MNINILEIIKNYQNKNIEFLQELGEFFKEGQEYIYIQGGINVFYDITKEDLLNIFVEDDEIKEDEKINNIYYIQFGKNDVYFEYNDEDLRKKDKQYKYVYYSSTKYDYLETRHEYYFNLNDADGYFVIKNDGKIDESFVENVIFDY